MKKKIVIGLIATMIGCSFVGCEDHEYVNEEGAKISSELKSINDNLVYDKNTHIVYYCMGNRKETWVTYMSPYISKEGTYCKYENGKVVPLEKGE